jgi:hypothetical protein
MDMWDERPSSDLAPVIGEAVPEAPTHTTARAVSKASTHFVADELLLCSESDPPGLVKVANLGITSSKSSVETLDGKLDNKQLQESSPPPAMSDGFETDDDKFSTSPSALDELKPSSR